MECATLHTVGALLLKMSSLGSFAIFLVISLTWSISHSVCVREWKANLRKGPGINFKKSWQVGKYMPFRQISKKGNWLKLKDVDGEIHWAHGSVLTRSVACVVVRSSFAYLRKGPGVKFAKVGNWIADRYTPYKKIRTKGGWVEVEDAKKQRFWIFKKHLWEPVRIQRINF